MPSFTDLMATIFNQVGRPLAWPDVKEIDFVRTVNGRHESYFKISINWFAWVAVPTYGLPLSESDGLPVIHLVVTDGTPGMSQSNMDLLFGVAVRGVLYRKDRIFPPIGIEPRFWLIELQTTGHPWSS